MKVLIYSIYVPKEVDGVSYSTRKLVASLEQKGIDVTICTTNAGWSPEETSKQRSEKLRIFNASRFSGADFSPGLFFFLERNSRKFDVIQLHGTFNFPTIFGAYTAIASQTPYIISPRGNLIPSTITDKRIYHAIRKRLFFLLLAQKALKNANRIICTSQKEQDVMRDQLNTDNITYINNGLDYMPYLKNVNPQILKETLNIDVDQPLFLFLGRFSKEKAIPFLFQVWELVSKEVPRAILVIAGESNPRYRGEMFKKIGSLSRPKSVLMIDSVIGDIKLALLQHSRCLLFPSYFESFGNVVLEALISGTPVIASTGTPWESLEENHFGYWLPWDIKNWKNGILAILNDGSYKSDVFLKRTRQWVIDNFNWSNVVDRYIEVYKEIQNRR